MKIATTVLHVYGCVLTALVLVTAVLCNDSKDQDPELEPLLCVVEEIGRIPFNYDILQVIREMASGRVHDNANFSMNRTVISSEDVFDFVNKGCNLLDPYCAAVITLASNPVVLIIDDWTQELFIPHLILSTDIIPCHVTSPNSLHLAPDGPIKGDVVHILIEKVLKWNELVFIYDDYLDMVQLAHLQSVLSQTLVSSGMFKLQPDLTDQIMEDVINATKLAQHVFLAVHSNLMSVVMEKAFTNNLFSKEYFWIVMSNTSCLDALNRSILRKSNVLFLRQTPFFKDSKQWDRSLVVTNDSYFQEQADLLLAGIQAFIKASLAADLYSSIYKSSSICDSRLVTTRKKAIIEARKQIIVTDRGDVVFDSSNGKVSSYGYEFCSSDDTATEGHVVVGSWSPYSGIKPSDRLFINAFKDFGGRKLLIGGVEGAPFVIKRKSLNKTEFEGFCIDILRELANKLNFTYEIIETPEKMAGAKNSNGSWTGVIGMVLRGEVEFGIGPLSITTQREDVIDFTIPYTEDGVGILIKRNKLDSHAMFRLFTPLQPVVWVCLGGSIIGVSLILYVINRLSPFPEREGLSFFSCYWAILGATLNQGSEIQPKSSSGRLVLGCWWVFTIVFVSTYTANMAAVLTVTIYDKPINSLVELAGQTDIRPVVRSGTTMYALFKDATNDIYKRIWSMMDTMPNITSSDDALALVRTKNFAYMTDRSQLEYIQQQNCESYMLADDIFNTGGMGFVVPENSAFLASMDQIIMKLQESGIIDGWRRQWWKGEGSACNGNDRVNSANQLDLNYLAGCFFVYLGAMALSIIMVFIERLFVTKCCKRLSRQTFLSNTA